MLHDAGLFMDPAGFFSALDAFGDRLDVDLGGDIGHRFEQNLATCVAVAVHHQGTVDLELVRAQLGQQV